MRATLTLASLAALVAAAPTGLTHDFCNGQGDVLVVGAPGHEVAYVTLDELTNSHFMFSVWIYMESNGVPDLQRGGANWFGDSDVCQDFENHDQAVL